MPLVKTSYRAPYHLPGGLIQTVAAGRKHRPSISMERETLTLSDGDFIDLDWVSNNNNQLIIVTHGLEGSSRSQYIVDLILECNPNKYDILVWNCRSCSGRMNKLQKLYHHGEIEDISEVVSHVLNTKKYNKLHLAGFSMGGNISIKFLSQNKELAMEITSCAVVSSPCDLRGSSNAMDRPMNFLLRKYFMRNIYKKLAAKEAQFPGSFPMEEFHKLKSWNKFDELFIAPFSGFNSVDEFYYDASANNFIEGVTTPLYLLNAKNDPVLPQSCHPIAQAKKSDNLFLELPRTGGHVYFPINRRNYAVQRIMDFVQNH